MLVGMRWWFSLELDPRRMNYISIFEKLVFLIIFGFFVNEVVR